MPPWLGVVLIITSLTALGLAVYCRVFMAPLQRFRERVSALGGGLKGVEAHFSGVAGELQSRVEELEGGTNARLAEARESLQGAVDGLRRDLREARGDVEKLRRDVQALQGDLRGTASDGMKVAQTADSLAKQLAQLRSDFEALDVELRESVRQLVGDSLATVESTVLAALEAIQEEMLHEVSEPAGPTSPFGARRGPSKPYEPGSGRGGRGNIITAEPLFAGLRHQQGQQGEPAGSDEEGESEEGAEGDDES